MPLRTRRLPAADWLARRRWATYAAFVLLLISVISASYTCLNPWSPPWIYQYWVDLGWAQP